jgi:tetratricopeptide (TPR) repeat protein
MKYKGTRKSAADAGQELKVDAVMEGSVLRSGARVRITAHLIRSANGGQLWSDSYERDVRDILALQSEVARAVAGEIRVKLTPPEQVRLAAARPVNPEAYDDYLRGKLLVTRANSADNQAAIEMFGRAVARDPNFAVAYAMLARAYADRLFFIAPEEQKQLEEKAYVATEKALSLDPDLSEAYLARGRLLWTPSNHFPHEEAVAEYRRALALNPNSDEARSLLALVYNHIGLLDEALREARQAAAINPSGALPLAEIGHALVWKGKYGEGLAVWNSLAGKYNPGVVGSFTAWTLFQLGRKREASAKIEEFLKDDRQDSAGVFAALQGLLLAAAGEQRGAEEKIRSAAGKKAFGHFHHTAYYIACAYARMNKPQPAIRWLQETAETGLPCYPLFEQDANLDGIRGDRDFISFMAGAKKQWEHYKATLFP